jgi:phospholipid/cholesterol/gamma-HCH transport system substrate-binding protein
MKTGSINRAVIVGVFIFLGIAIFVTGVFTLGSERKTFASSITVKVIFQDVGGLQEGNNVWLSGVKIGTVKKIRFQANTEVEVQLNIDKDVKSHITKDAKAKVGSDGFIGNKIVVIYGGTQAAAGIADGDSLAGEQTVGMEDLMASLQTNSINLIDITGDLKVISKRIRDGQGTIGQLINDPAIAYNLRATMGHFRKTAVSSERAVAKINEYIDGLNTEGTLVNQLMTDTTAFAKFRETLEQLKAASYSISAFAENLKQAGLSLHRTDNPAGAILNDSVMAADLKTITRNLNTSSQKLDEDLKALQSNFLFKGYFKNQEKERKKQEKERAKEQNKKRDSL